MFNSLGIHVIQFPSRRYGFAGTLPMSLATMIPATTSDIMGGRAITGPDGKVYAPKFPSFESADEARAFAVSLGLTVG